MLSVLIPTFNNEKHLSKAIASCISLKYVAEIIIMDDCSQDDTELLIKKIKKNIHIIKYYKNNRNLGVGKSFIKAIKKSNYPYILMLNSDDFFIPKGIDNLFDFTIKNHLDLSYGKMAIQKKNKIFKYSHPGYLNKSYVNNRNEFIDLMIFDMYMPSFGTIIKKSILQNFYDIKYMQKLDEEFGDIFKAHDYDLFLNLTKKNNKVGFLNEFVCVWKPSESSQSGETYFSTGCAAAESAFLFNRYFDNSLIKKKLIKKKIFNRINQKYLNAIINKKLYNDHYEKFLVNLNF